MLRAIEWVEEPEVAIRLIDQTKLPATTELLNVTTVDVLVDAIQRLVVRGAPALGAAGAYGVALAMVQAEKEGWDSSKLDSEIARIREARPTAVNLAWAVDVVSPLIKDGFQTVLDKAKTIAQEDEEANRELSRRGADWILEHTDKEKVTVITHCNTGALATTAWGTALGVIRELNERGALEFVYVDETRPLLQGARLTSWELKELSIPHKVQVDGAASSTILRGNADVAIIGADRITANGDTANKIGSVALALAAQRAGIPFMVAAPVSTIDMDTKDGSLIVIEERPDEEVHKFGQSRTTPEGVEAFNPAFDVTPNDLISAITTENGVVEPATNPSENVMAQVMK